MNRLGFVLMPLLDDLGDPSGGGSPAAAIPAAPTPAPATGGAFAPQPATSAAPVAAPAPAAPEAMVPSYRLREAREAAVRQAREESTRQIAEIRAEADRYRTQLQALVGVQPPQNPERDSVRNQLFQVAPSIKLMEERAEDIQRLIDDAGALRQQTEHYWNSYGRQTMDRLFKQAEGSLGSPLTDEGKRALHSAFTGFVSSSPELTQRYESDPSLVEDFWQMFNSSFVDPARRSATATVAGRLPGNLPQDNSSGALRTTPVPKPQTLDERMDLGWQQYQTLHKG